MKNNRPPKPEQPHSCGGDWYWPIDVYEGHKQFTYGPKQWICRRCHPPFEHCTIINDLEVALEGLKRESRGRPRYSISLKSICDTLKAEQDINASAKKLGCSRPYIYQELTNAGTNPKAVMAGE